MCALPSPLQFANPRWGFLPRPDVVQVPVKVQEQAQAMERGLVQVQEHEGDEQVAWVKVHHTLGLRRSRVVVA